MPKRTRQHCGRSPTDTSPNRLSVTITSNCLGQRHQLHGARIVSIHVRQIDIWIFLVVDFLHHVAPQDAGFHDIGLLHRADLVAAAAGQFKRRPRHAGNLGFRIALGIDAYTLIAFGENASRFAEIDAARSVHAR